MDEDNYVIDEEELRAQVKQMAEQYLYGVTSVPKTIEDEKKALEEAKASFKSLWETYNNTKKSRSYTAYLLRREKIRIGLYKALLNLFQAFNKQDACEELDNLSSSITISLQELRDEKDLFAIIRLAIKELSKYQAIDCNYDISELLALMYNKHRLIYAVEQEDWQSFQVRNRGINYISNGVNRAELDQTNQSIEEKIQGLELKPRY